MTFTDMALRESLVSRADCSYISPRSVRRSLNNSTNALVHLSIDNGSLQRQQRRRKAAIFWANRRMADLLGLVRLNFSSSSSSVTFLPFWDLFGEQLVLNQSILVQIITKIPVSQGSMLYRHDFVWLRPRRFWYAPSTISVTSRLC